MAVLHAVIQSQRHCREVGSLHNVAAASYDCKYCNRFCILCYKKANAPSLYHAVDAAAAAALRAPGVQSLADLFSNSAAELLERLPQTSQQQDTSAQDFSMPGAGEL